MGGLGFTWSDFGSSEQRKRHVKPNPDRSAQRFYQTALVKTRPSWRVSSLSGQYTKEG
ncbi:hypothetical protein HMPREF9374_2398 [Desmospora sp. 8437]|nr:hypothetical protein HMPREF9374_2398 [Desmospora sp. 8437]